MEAFGAPDDVVQAVVERERSVEVFEIHTDNASAVRTFLALQTQWRVVVPGMGSPVWQGIEYASLPAAFDLLEVPRHKRGVLFADLRVMESAALVVLNERKEVESDGG